MPSTKIRGRVTVEGHLPNFIVNNTKYQRFCSFITWIAYMYTSSVLPSEEIRNSSTIYSKMDLLGLPFLKQVNFLNKIVTSYFEHYIKTDFCNSVKLCMVIRAEHAGVIVFLIHLPWPMTILVDMYIDIYIDSIILTYGIQSKYTFCFRK